ncbi:acetyltransferase [Aquirufa salirivi]|uniref:Acetyltransferase n=1 Tax=Aquirufa salirivi TaxID=3104729 RepID=A0ABW8RVG4_9BACT
MEYYIDKICIIGSSGAMLSMVLDNLESRRQFPVIYLLNNLGLELETHLFHKAFEIIIIDKLEKEHVSLPFILGVNKVANKQSIVQNLQLEKEKFVNLTHLNTSISSTTVIKHGVIVNCLTSIAANSILNEFVTINRNVSIGHDTEIGAYSTINPGVNIAGFVKIGDRCTIGMGANVLDGVKIGENTIIGAGSLVTKDIPDGVVAYGNPCKIIRKNEI